MKRDLYCSLLLLVTLACVQWSYIESEGLMKSWVFDYRLELFFTVLVFILFGLFLLLLDRIFIFFYGSFFTKTLNLLLVIFLFPFYCVFIMPIVRFEPEYIKKGYDYYALGHDNFYGIKYLICLVLSGLASVLTLRLIRYKHLEATIKSDVRDKYIAFRRIILSLLFLFFVSSVLLYACNRYDITILMEFRTTYFSIEMGWLFSLSLALLPILLIYQNWQIKRKLFKRFILVVSLLLLVPLFSGLLFSFLYCLDDLNFWYAELDLSYVFRFRDFNLRVLSIFLFSAGLTFFLTRKICEAKVC